MNIGADLSAVLADTHGPAMECELHIGESRIPARLLLTRGGGRGGATGARSVMGWALTTELPRGADWATALLLAGSLPLGVAVDDVEAIDDRLGTLWRVEGSMPMAGIVSRTIDGKTVNGVIGWRLALRGTQRGVR